MLIYLTLSHMGAFWALMVWTLFGGVCPVFGQEEKPMKWETVYWAFFLYLIGGLGITAGVHRLWAHRTYKAALPLRIVLMIFNSVANQGTIYHWARDHRVHHLYSDTDADPHDANRGFWYSHCGWLVMKKRREVAEAGRKVNVEDLRLDPVVMFQKRVDPFWNLIWCFAMPAFVALRWDDTLWNGFLVAGAFKYIWTLNITWCVNSVVHAWGTKPYNPVHLTTENGWVSLFALGEGWHNWHHAFDWDYAAAELEAWYQFNPTKVFIDTMALLGLVWGRKRASKVWDLRKAKWEEETGRKVIESMEGPPLFKRRVVTLGPQPYDDDHDEVASGGN
jgi:stearoyl-CoA desaturase (delta-9 desaturase)